MAVTAEQVRAALLVEEPDYPKVAKKLGAGALRHLSAIVGSGDSLLAAKAAYLAGVIGGPTSGDVVAKAARHGEAPVRIAAAAAAGQLAGAESARAAAGRPGVAADRDSILLQLVDDADPGVRKVALRSVPSSMSDALRERVTALRLDATAAPMSAPAAGRARAGTRRAGQKKKAAGTVRGRKAAAMTRGRKRRS